MGEDSDFYLQKGFRVLAADASKKLCEILMERFAIQIEQGKFKIVNYAITDEDHNSITFYENVDNSVWGTVFEQWDERNKKFGTKSIKQVVETIRLDSLVLQEVEADEVLEYIKIDIEGADMLALKSLANVKRKPKFISIESEKRSWSNLEEEFKIFKKLGYSKFKIVDQSRIESQVCPSPAKEGGFVDYKFEPGCTGLFGDELPGEWLSEEEALKVYKKIFSRYYFFGDYGILNNKLIMKNRLLNKVMGIFKLKYPHVGWYDTHAKM